MFQAMPIKTLSLLSTLVFFFLGCMEPINFTPNTGEPELLSLEEVSKKLDLRIEEAAFWGDRKLIGKDGERFFIQKDNDVYWYKGMGRQVEYPGVVYRNGELFIPLGMYNSMCLDLGQVELMKNYQPSVAAQDDFKIKRAGDILRHKKQPLKPQVKTTLKGVALVIDAGHGGKDPGAVVPQTYEKDVALKVALKVEKLLRAQGAEVYMTRSDDSYPTLAERAGLANTYKVDLFISIHANAAENKSAQGIETLYSDQGQRGNLSKAFAQSLNQSMVQAVGAVDRKAKADVRGLHVLKHTTMPAALVELGFLTNQEEVSKLTQNSYQDLLAEAIVQGVIQYQSTQKISISR